MKLIMNEKKFLENIIKTKKIPIDMSSGYIIRLFVLNYFSIYKDKNGLINFVNSLFKEFEMNYYVEYKIHSKIKKIVYDMWDKEKNIRELDFVPLYTNELEIIKTCESNREKKLLFVCYIIARLYNSEWINITDKELFELANMSMTNNNRQMFLYKMIQKRYISQSSRNQNLAIKVNNISKEDEEIIYKVENFNNLGNQLMVLLNSGYKQCESCGKLIKIKSKTKPEKYCDKCAYVVNLDKQKERDNKKKTKKS